MSPEQALGDSVDRRADVFGLGILLYQLATGTHPYRGDTDAETFAGSRSAIRWFSRDDWRRTTRPRSKP